MKKQWKKLVIIIAVFLGCFYLPVGIVRFDNAIAESLHLVKWYAREHVLLCLIPAFFIAGAIAVFVSKNSVMKYLGAKANKILAYGVASIAGLPRRHSLSLTYPEGYKKISEIQR